MLMITNLQELLQVSKVRVRITTLLYNFNKEEK